MANEQGGNVLAAVMKLTDDYTLTMKKIIQSQKEYETGQKAVDAATQKTNSTLAQTASKTAAASSGVSKLVTRLTTLVSTAYAVRTAFRAMFSAINTSALQKIQETTYQALLNNDQAGTALYSYVGAYAKQSALGREDIAKGMTTFLTYSRDMDELERMVKMVERLYAKDPSKGTDQAVFSLKEILAGDVVSMRNAYNITGFSGESIRNKMSAGDTAGALDEIDAVLNKFGATQSVVDRNFDGLLSQVNLFTSNMKTEIGEQATSVMENLAATMRRLNENFDSGKYQPFINMMVNGFNAVGNAMAWAAENATTLIPILGGVVMAIVAYNAAVGIATVVTGILAIEMTPMILGWIALGAVIIGVAAALGIASGAMDDVTKKFNSVAGVAKSLAQSKSDAASGLSALPVELTNTDPISVKGTVEIESENLKYLIDFAGMKFFAQYSNVTPQMNVYNPNISERVSMADMFDQFGNLISSAASAQPEGSY